MYRLLLLLFFVPSILTGASVQVMLEAPGYKGKQAQLIRFSDYFTLTPELLSAEFVGEDGTVKLDGDINQTELALIRIDHVNAYLYLSPNADLKAIFPPLSEGMARSMGNTNTVELSFIGLEHANANAYMSKLNAKISEFYELYLSYERIEDQKAAGGSIVAPKEGLATDPPKKKSSLKMKVDSLSSALQDTFKGLEDPILQAELDYSIALLYLNANVGRNWLFDEYFRGRKAQLNCLAWVDLFRSFYQYHFIQGPMFSHEIEFRKALEFDKDPKAVAAILMQNDLVDSEEMADLLLMNGIYEYYHSEQFSKKALREVLNKMRKIASSKQLAVLAGYILTDLATLERYLPAPEFTLIDNDRNTVKLEDFIGEYSYIGFWASWCSSCMKELAVMKKHHEEYGKYVHFLTINIDEDVYERAEALSEMDLPWMDLYHLNDPLILDRYRIRSVPQFFLIGPEGQVLEAPADKPSEGIAAKMHRIKVAAKKNEQIKIWDD